MVERCAGESDLAIAITNRTSVLQYDQEPGVANTLQQTTRLSLTAPWDYSDSCGDSRTPDIGMFENVRFSCQETSRMA